MLGPFSKTDYIKKQVANLFLAMYAGVLILFPIHALTHLQPEEELCYEAENACHLRTVHHDTVNGCDHEVHVTKANPGCEICPIYQVKYEQEVADFTIDTPEFEVNAQIIFPDHDYSKAWIADNFTRGPPSNS